MASVTVVLDVERITKNTIRFQERVEGEYDAPLVGQIYVPKPTLGQLGFKDGDSLSLTLEIADS